MFKPKDPTLIITSRVIAVEVVFTPNVRKTSTLTSGINNYIIIYRLLKDSA